MVGPGDRDDFGVGSFHSSCRFPRINSRLKHHLEIRDLVGLLADFLQGRQRHDDGGVEENDVGFENTDDGEHPMRDLHLFADNPAKGLSGHGAEHDLVCRDNGATGNNSIGVSLHLLNRQTHDEAKRRWPNRHHLPKGRRDAFDRRIGQERGCCLALIQRAEDVRGDAALEDHEVPLVEAQRRLCGSPQPPCDAAERDD
ncbi:MAG: hypothetical protein B6D36_02355 [Planctomycetes bacterium UTPLA1]|nr:MAG: hypothetical protein B6D36_02355 [Planctomycetes bacterium UTPLA1]